MEEKKYEYRKLKGKIKEKYNSQLNFAEDLGISVQALNRKLSGRTAFSQKDISKSLELLEIPSDEIYLYFFA